MASLVQDCLQLDTTSISELRSLYDLLQLKSMLHDKYGIVDFNFSDGTTGQVSDHLSNNISLPSLSPALYSLHPAPEEVQYGD